MTKYRATSPKNPDTNYTQEVVLEVDNKGEPTKVVAVGGDPVDLTDDERSVVSRYLNLTKNDGSSDDKSEVSPDQEVGRDLPASPNVGSSQKADQKQKA